MENAITLQDGLSKPSLAAKNGACFQYAVDAGNDDADDAGVIVFMCPETQRGINSRIHTNWRTYLTLRQSNVSVYCRHCRRNHEFDMSFGRLTSWCPSQIESLDRDDQFAFAAMWVEE